MRVTIEAATSEHLAALSALAAVIWRAHYPGIISHEQINHMLSRMYDVDAMRRELESGTAWFRALTGDAVRGFAAAKPSAVPKEFKLDKLYVHPDWQGRGIGSALLREVESMALVRGAGTLVLNVNKRNTTAIAAYHHCGFRIRESCVADIGGGFVMDDYVMGKDIASSPPAT